MASIPGLIISVVKSCIDRDLCYIVVFATDNPCLYFCLDAK
jgi:hypothetical protein